jgi:hypothetical protein
VNERSDEGRKPAKGFEGLLTPMRVETDPGEPTGGQHMPPVPLAFPPQTRLVGVATGAATMA